MSTNKHFSRNQRSSEDRLGNYIVREFLFVCLRERAHLPHKKAQNERNGKRERQREEKKRKGK